MSTSRKVAGDDHPNPKRKRIDVDAESSSNPTAKKILSSGTKKRRPIFDVGPNIYGLFGSKDEGDAGNQTISNPTSKMSVATKKVPATPRKLFHARKKLPSSTKKLTGAHATEMPGATKNRIQEEDQGHEDDIESISGTQDSGHDENGSHDENSDGYETENERGGKTGRKIHTEITPEMM